MLMSTLKNTRIPTALCLSLVMLQSSLLFSQDVTIKREAIAVLDPRNVNVPIRVLPVRHLDIVAGMDGYIRAVSAKSNAIVTTQAELCRLDDAQTTLLIEKAKAYVEAAEADLRIASAKNDMDQKAAAQARASAAKAELKLAELKHEQTRIKAPFAGEVLRVLVAPGQFVRAGEKLMELVDSTSIVVEVPVDRSQVKVGGDLTFSIERTSVTGKIQALLPPQPHFEPLRTMVHNLSTAIITIDNTKGEFFPGQTVFAPAVPQQPFGQVAVTAIQNGTEGLRKVQIVRQGTVRDIPVEVLTQMGSDRLFVAGAFLPDDEIVVTSSQPLKDGQRLRVKAAPRTADATGTTPGIPSQPATAQPKTGF